MRIYKYRAADKVLMRRGARILKAGYQNGELMIWALVDEMAEYEQYSFRLIGTGHEADVSGFTYLDTVFEGALVWHIFYKRVLKA